MPSVVGCAFPRLPLRGRLSAFRLSLSGFALVAGVLMAALPAAASSTATTTTLAVTSGGVAVTTVNSGSVVTLTATVKAGTTPVSPGLVKFCDAEGAHCTDVHVLGTAQLTSAGTAIFKFRAGVGSHAYNAIFAGTPNGVTAYAASSSGTEALAVTASVATTTTSIAQNGGVGNYTLTATVDGAGSIAPTGTVSFLDTSSGNALLGTATLSAGTAGLIFVNTPTTATGYRPSAVAVGDLNGDGVPDLAVVNECGSDPNCGAESPGTVTILLGNGDGTFNATSVSPTVGLDPTAIAVGDFNGDGKQDLAVATAGGVWILLGKGDGTFNTGEATSSAGSQSPAIVVGDFNGDGIPDLAALAPGDTVAILLGNGDGTFTQTVASPVTGSNPKSIAVGDFNGDGYPDLAVVNECGSDPNCGAHSPGTVTILLSNGDGTFTAKTPSPEAGYYPSAIAAADFNGDGFLDLAVVPGCCGDYGTKPTLAMLMGNGDGTFTLSPTSTYLPGPDPGYDYGSYPFMGIGDFNADGFPGLAVWGSFEDVTVTLYEEAVLPGKGDGTFQAPVSLLSRDDVAGLAVGDFNGDGYSDLTSVFLCTYGSLACPDPGENAGAVQVYLTENQISTTASIGGVAFPAATGTHNVVASYSGDSNYNPSTSGATTLTAAKGTPTVTVTSSANPAPYGTLVTLTVTVTGSGPTPTGGVTFYDGGELLGTRGLNSSGLATFVTSGFPLGSSSITVTYAGDSNYNSANSLAYNLTVIKGAQTINFPAITAAQHALTQLNLSATASSGLAVTIVSTTPAVCTVSGSTASLLIGGTCTLQATQAGNADYGAAPMVSQSFMVHMVPQTITFSTLSSQPVGANPKLTATANSGLTVAFASITPAVCTVSGTTASMLATGSCVIHATQAGNGVYSLAPTVSQDILVRPFGETITFPAITATQYAASTLGLSATANSGLAVSFASTTPAVCTVSGSTASLLTAGSCILHATQAGNVTYAAATPVTQVVVVHLAPQTITFPVIPSSSAGANVTLSATASSGLAVGFASATSSICTVSGSTASMLTMGTCIIHATQAGSNVYSAAPMASRSINVEHAQTISFPAITGTHYALSSLLLSATASSGLAVSFASTTHAVCTVAGTTASLLIGGSCTIQATQAGNTVYGAAPPVSQNITVSPLSQSLTFPTITATAYATTQISLAATASSGLAVSFVSTTPAVCTVSGSAASLLVIGTCAIRAAQDGNAAYSAATAVGQSLTVHHETQTITFPAIAPQVVGVYFALYATASSGLPVSFASTTTTVCTVSGSNVSMLTPGTCVIHATQAGNTAYAAAPLVSLDITVKAN